jgi:hypothetical protein
MKMGSMKMGMSYKGKGKGAPAPAPAPSKGKGKGKGAPSPVCRNVSFATVQVSATELPSDIFARLVVSAFVGLRVHYLTQTLRFFCTRSNGATPFSKPTAPG